MVRRLGAIVVTALAMALSGGVATASAAPLDQPRRAVAAVTDVAHRGASAYAPENTIAAVELAHEQGADMFEVDVQETRDHALVLMHDTTLNRTTDVEEIFPGRAPWHVGDFTLAEIRRLDAGSWFGPEYAGEPVPTLGETLRVMADKLGLLLEVKSPELYPGIERRIADELRREQSWLVPDPGARRLVVQSFDWDSMRAFHEIMAQVPIGLLGTPARAELPDLAAFADQINPTFTDVTAEFVAEIHRLDMEIFTWTVNDTTVMRDMIATGVDGIITNNPDLLREVIDGEAAA